MKEKIVDFLINVSSRRSKRSRDRGLEERKKQTQSRRSKSHHDEIQDSVSALLFIKLNNSFFYLITLVAFLCSNLLLLQKKVNIVVTIRREVDQEMQSMMSMWKHLLLESFVKYLMIF